MIPLRDNIRPRKKPYINYLLIIFNIYVFLQQIKLTPKELDFFINTYGVVPQKIANIPIWTFFINYEHFIPLLTSIFIHGSLLHIAGNMLYLWVFGDNIEDRLGHLNYLLFYLATGLLGNIAHITMNPLSPIPTVGASGAIAGILGAYFIAFPNSKILTLIPIFFFITITQVKAFYFLFIWFFLQLINGLSGFGIGESVELVAWWAHIGGFISGVILYFISTGRKFK